MHFDIVWKDSLFSSFCVSVGKKSLYTKSEYLYYRYKQKVGQFITRTFNASVYLLLSHSKACNEI